MARLTIETASVDSSSTPHLQTELPGPRARLLIDADEQVTSPCLARPYPLAASHAQGCVVIDVDGNRFLDFAAGIAVCSTGHCHPRVVKAIQEQAGSLIHFAGTDFYYEAYVDLTTELVALCPETEPWRGFLCNSGAEAVEGAMKLARHATGRTHFIAFTGAFHGRTAGALSLTSTSSKHHKGFGPLLAGVTHVPFGYCFRCPLNLTYPDCGLACVDYIEREVFAHSVAPESVAAIVVEPILGSGGYVVPPADWLPAIRTLCDRHEILLVVDEVQSGMGRTGRMFAFEHSKIVPDIIALSKGIASGMPLGAILAKASLMTWGKGAHGSTLGGNPVSCAAALETISLLKEGLVENAARVGAYILAKLQSLQTKYQALADVRGLGLMVGLEFQTGLQAKAIAEECFRQGLIVLECGEKSIRLSPPLIVTEAQADIAVGILEVAIRAQEAHKTDES